MIYGSVCSTIEHLLPLFLLQLKDEVSDSVVNYMCDMFIVGWVLVLRSPAKHNFKFGLCQSRLVCGSFSIVYS